MGRGRTLHIKVNHLMQHRHAQIIQIMLQRIRSIALHNIHLVSILVCGEVHQWCARVRRQVCTATCEGGGQGVRARPCEGIVAEDEELFVGHCRVAGGFDLYVSSAADGFPRRPPLVAFVFAKVVAWTGDAIS